MAHHHVASSNPAATQNPHGIHIFNLCRTQNLKYNWKLSFRFFAVSGLDAVSKFAYNAARSMHRWSGMRNIHIFKPPPSRPSNYDENSTTTGRSRTSSVTPGIPKQTRKHKSHKSKPKKQHTHTQHELSTFHRVRPCVRVWFASVYRALATLHKHNYYWCWSSVCIAASFLLLSLRFALLTRNFIVSPFCQSFLTLRAEHYTNSFCVCFWPNGAPSRIRFDGDVWIHGSCQRNVNCKRLAESNGISSQHLSWAKRV